LCHVWPWKGRSWTFWSDLLKESVQWNDMTFICLLSACSRAGLVDEGICSYGSMMTFYTISVKLEHKCSKCNYFVQDAPLFLTTKPAAPSPHEKKWGQPGGACCYISVCTCNDTILQYTMLISREHQIETKAALRDQGSHKLSHVGGITDHKVLRFWSPGRIVHGGSCLYVSLGSNETASQSEISFKHIWHWGGLPICSSGFLFPLCRLIRRNCLSLFNMCWIFGFH
jgi:hypothetical protein